MAAAEFVGKFKLEKSDNFDDFMKALGVGYVLRKVGNSVYPELTISNENDHVTLTSVSTFKTTTLEFDLNKEFQTTTVDGRKVRSTVTLEDKKLVQKEYPLEGNDESKNCVYIRELDANNDLKITCTVGDIECVRLYKRLTK
ncbi:fatty acid-binding protein, liver-like [Diadema antillarum]|uniref:fatty acid-binding protein, liver-like n=1 Tax=Diadema antillarum TaxID=105358 RepID=UPI003A898D81